MSDFLEKSMSRRKAGKLLGRSALLVAIGANAELIMSSGSIKAHAGSASSAPLKANSVFVLIEASISKGQTGNLITFLQENLPNTRRASGALKIDVLLDKNTGALMIYEEWRTREHHKNYVKTITDNGVLNQLIGFFKAPPSMKYYEKLGI